MAENDRPQVDLSNPFTPNISCGPGSVEVRVVSGAWEYSGCASLSEAAEYLIGNGDIAKIPADSPLGARLISKATAEKLKEWNELKEAYENGEATLRDLQNFDPGALSSNETWMGRYNDYVTQESQAPKTWEEIEEILRRNGYSDSEIQEVKDSIRPPGGEFQGSLVLPGILSELGYEGGDWWDVRPVSGTPCDADGFFGTYDEDGNCVSTGIEGKEGDPCGVGGTRDKYGVCQGEDTGDEGADEGTDEETPDCTVVTQENAEECGYEITSDGQLIPVDPNLPNNYVSCGDNIFVEEGTECPETPETLEDLIGEFGEAAVDTAQQVYDYIEDKIGEIKDDPLGVLREILTGGVLSGDERCWEGDMQSCDTANPDDGDICWKDCVNIVGVLGIPGIPLPPGISDFGTVRDLEDFLKGIGKDIGEFIEDPAGAIEGWIEGIIDKIKGVFDSTADDASAVIDWLKGIFGAAVGAWVWGQIEEEVTNTILPNLQPYGMCPDGETPKTGPTNEGCPEPAVSCWDGTLVYKKEECTEDTRVDCSSFNRNGGKAEECGPCLPSYTEDEDGNCVPWEDSGSTAEECAAENRVHVPSTGAGTDSACGGCLPDFELNETGDCVASPIKCEGNQRLNETTGECEDPPPDCTPGGPCKDETGASGTYDDNCDCIADWINSGPSEQDCAALGKIHVPADDSTQTPSSCGACEQEGWTDTGDSGECVDARVDCWDGSKAPSLDQCPEDTRVDCWDGSKAPSLDQCPEDTRVDCWDGAKANSLEECSEDTRVDCWDGSKATSLEACPEDTRVDCWDGSKAESQEQCPVKPWENTGPTEEDCANQGKTFIAGDPETQTPSKCGDDVIWDGNCTSPQPDAAQSSAHQAAHRAWAEQCGQTHCTDGSTIDSHVNNDCQLGLTSDCQEITEANAAQCGKEKCPDGTFADIGACSETPPEETCPNGDSPALHIDNDCNQPCRRGLYDFGEGCVSLTEVCTNPQTDEEYRVCGQHEQCGKDTDNPGKWVKDLSECNTPDDPGNEGDECTDAAGNKGFLVSNEKGDLECKGGTGTPSPQVGDDCPLGDNPTGGVLQENPETGELVCVPKGTPSPPPPPVEPPPPPEEECVTPDGTPTGAIPPDCTKCPTGQDFNTNGICVDTDLSETCDDPNADNYGEDGECVYGPTPVVCDDPNAVNDGEDGPCECKPGFSKDPETLLCVGGTPSCDNGAIDYPTCTECPDGSIPDAIDGCAGPTINCADYNQQTNEDGTCGPCLPGYVKDTSQPDEPCVAEPEDPCPAGFALNSATGLCEPVTCPDGESFCEATGQCETAENCPDGGDDGGDDGGGGGGGAGGGGGGMFDIKPITISGDPQLLSRTEFPITDFLAGLFTGSGGGRA